tara:strand:- start:1019 stop:1369 length:351 start_codon:yes stop_codon:yes gene_type:complete
MQSLERRREMPVTARPITERQFGNQIEHLMLMFGWKFYHVLEQRVYAKRTSKGFPDYVAVRSGTCLFIELKSEIGKMTPAQNEWRIELNQVCRFHIGFLYYLWRPSDIEEAIEVLR